MDELISKLPEAQKNIAMKRDRRNKWSKMVSYGLDLDIAEKVFK